MRIPLRISKIFISDYSLCEKKTEKNEWNPEGILKEIWKKSPWIPDAKLEIIPTRNHGKNFARNSDGVHVKNPAFLKTLKRIPERIAAEIIGVF